MANKNTFKHVKIEANSRLHLGFISLNSSTPFTYGGELVSRFLVRQLLLI